MIIFYGLFLLVSCGEKTDSGADPDIHVSNAGPDGASVVKNTCGPADGLAYLFVVHPLSETCQEENIDTNWSVSIQHNSDSIESGTKYTINTEALFFLDEEAYLSKEGEFWIEFERGCKRCNIQIWSGLARRIRSQRED